MKGIFRDERPLKNERISAALPPKGRLLTDRRALVCRLCGMEASHNPVLGLTFCPIHGLASPLDTI